MEMLVFAGAAVVKITVVMGVVLLTVAFLTLAERKVLSWMQDRMGPMEVGPYGTLQPIADGIKLFFKEDIIPAGANRFLFSLAPILSRSLRMVTSAEKRAGGFWHWTLIGGLRIVAFVVYLIPAVAETNRLPFDLPEAESELVAGWMTEYSGMRFAFFFMAEYANMILVSCIASVLFLGGYHAPYPGTLLPANLAWIEGVAWFTVKVYGFLFLFFWLRATLPRLRYDQLMRFGWKVMLPLALGNIVITAIVVYFLRD